MRVDCALGHDDDVKPLASQVLGLHALDFADILCRHYELLISVKQDAH